MNLPQLLDDDIKLVQQLFADKMTVKQIQNYTGLRYTIIYYYVVNNGKPAAPAQPHFKKEKHESI